MKRALKWTVRVVFILAGLLLLVLLATVTTVDHTPYRDLPAWRIRVNLTQAPQSACFLLPDARQY